MHRDKAPSIAYLIFASGFSLALAYLFGNDGYESFLTVAIALWLLISWYVLCLGNLIFHARTWVIVKFFGVMALFFFWFITLNAAIFTISPNVFDPSIPKPSVNWIVVLLGTLPFLYHRTSKNQLHAGFKLILMSFLTALYSIIVLLIAVFGYHENGAKNGNLILVLSVQLQYLMSQIVTRTQYVTKAHAFAASMNAKLRIKGDLGHFLTVLIVGAPFILPLGLIILSIAYNH